MRIIITVSFAAESVMKQGLSLLIGLTDQPMRIIPFVSCAAESVIEMEQDLSLLIGPTEH
jgi:hypothetical protein